jgi:CubicO group peptidase (beta-lactamase class C family)
MFGSIRCAAVLTAAILIVPALHGEQSAGSSPDQPSLRDALQAKFQELHQAGSFPGGTAAVASEGQVIGLAVGVSDRTTKTPMKTTDRLLLGSVGKTYVSAVALQLVHEGKIGLQDPIAKYFANEPWASVAVQVNSSAPRSTGRPLRAFITEFAQMIARK